MCNKKYSFETSCIHSTAELIDAMTERATQISYKTMLKHCNGLVGWAGAMKYSTSGEGLKLWEDWAVGFWKSTYNGMPCYYISHSRIEYIWVKNETH